MMKQPNFVFPPEVLKFMQEHPDKTPQLEVDLIISHKEKDAFGNPYEVVEQCVKPHSFVQALIYILAAHMRQTAASSTILDTSDAAITVGLFTANTLSWHNFNAAAADNDGTLGIQLGTGSTSVGITNNKLVTAIAHGIGAGQLDYQACTVSQVTIDSGVCSFTITREFVNSSGGNITVNEVGLIVEAVNSGDVIKKFIVDRTLNTATINNGTSKTYTYKIKVTV